MGRGTAGSEHLIANIRGMAVHVNQIHSSEPVAWRLFLALSLVWLCLFLIALTGYPNLMDNSLRVPSYVLDAVQNGHWLIQRDVMGDVAAKPPMLTWLIALVTLAEGHLSQFGI